MVTPVLTYGPRINVEQATIRTATVEVRTLAISGKQVTLSVFRQLQNEPLIHPDTCELLGVPWGRVNYFFGKCEADHLHVVWQAGDELRRACVWPERPLTDRESKALAGWQNTARSWAKRLLAVRLLEGSIPKQPNLNLNSWLKVTAPSGRITPIYVAGLPESAAYMLRWGRQDHHHLLLQRWLNQEAGADAGELFPKIVIDSLENAVDTIEDWERAIAHRAAKWSSQFEALQALDQLFIAV